MLRRDLKPGQFFRYTHPIYSNGNYAVPPIEGNLPIGYILSNVPLNDEEVVLIPPPFDAPPPIKPSAAHYQASEIEVVEAIEAWGLDKNWNLANVVKYVARAGKKANVDYKQDLQKARDYLGRAIAAAEGRKAWA